MTAIKQGMLCLLLAALIAMACWMGYNTYSKQLNAGAETPVDAEYVDRVYPGHYSEM